jgi:hypothetical protein
MYASFIGSRLTKTRLTLINRTQLRTKGQSAGYHLAQIEITFNSFQRRAIVKLHSFCNCQIALVLNQAKTSGPWNWNNRSCFGVQLSSKWVHEPGTTGFLFSLPAVVKKGGRGCSLNYSSLLPIHSYSLKTARSYLAQTQSISEAKSRR